MNVNGYEIKPYADLRDANLRGADLRGAYLGDANLSGANLSGATVPVSTLDPRGYQLHIQFAPNHLIFIIPGCKSFTLEQARAHWSDDNYEDPARGKMYVKQCELLQELYLDGCLPQKPWNTDE